MDIMMDYHKILDVPQTASLEDIKKAYRSKVLRWHPDKNPDNRKEAEQKFKEIVEAYKVLSDKSTHNLYTGNSHDFFKGTERSEAEKHLSVFDLDGIKIFFTRKHSSSDFSVSFFSAPKRFHHFSIMTAFINGKKITTKRHLENESKYLEVEEDGKTISIHVNGIPVYERDNNGATRNGWNYKLDKGHRCPGKWTCENLQWAREWHCWAKKWRSWAEECRDWAEERHHQEDKGCSRAGAKNCQKDKQYPKVNEEHSKSEKGCPRPGGKHPPFSMPGDMKPDLNERQYKTNKGQTWPEEKLTRPEKGYFVFPKPGEKNSGVDETHDRKNKKQHRPEEGLPMSDKGDPGFSKSEEGHAVQDVRMNKGQPKPDEGCFQEDKEHHGFQRPDQETLAHKKSDPVDTESPTASGCSPQAGNKKAPLRKHEQQSEESKQQTMKSESPLGKNEQKNVKPEPQGEDGECIRSGPEKRTELHDAKKKASARAKQAPKPQLTTTDAKGPSPKRKVSPMRMRKPCAKWTRSQMGIRKLYSRRTPSQAGLNRMPDEPGKAGIEWIGLCTRSKEGASERKKVSVDGKPGLPGRKKCPLPPLQELSLLVKKRQLRRRVAHHLPSETGGEKPPSSSEAHLLLGTSSQQRRRVVKLPRDIAHLPSIRGQKLKTNWLPNVIH